MQIQRWIDQQGYERIGYLGYKLYRLGWRSSLHKHLPLIEHWLLSIFFYYRRGFVDGSEWLEDNFR